MAATTLTELIVRLHFPSQKGNLQGPSGPASRKRLKHSARLRGVPDGNLVVQANHRSVAGLTEQVNPKGLQSPLLALQ